MAYVTAETVFSPLLEIAVILSFRGEPRAYVFESAVLIGEKPCPIQDRPRRGVSNYCRSLFINRRERTGGGEVVASRWECFTGLTFGTLATASAFSALEEDGMYV